MQNVETSAFSTHIEKLEHDLSKLRMQASTKQKVLELFRRYGYEYEFRTSHVVDVFHVKNSRANLVIRELTAAGILESPHYGTYRFASKNKSANTPAPDFITRPGSGVFIVSCYHA